MTSYLTRREFIKSLAGVVIVAGLAGAPDAVADWSGPIGYGGGAVTGWIKGRVKSGYLSGSDPDRRVVRASVIPVCLALRYEVTRKCSRPLTATPCVFTIHAADNRFRVYSEAAA